MRIRSIVVATLLALAAGCHNASWEAVEPTAFDAKTQQIIENDPALIEKLGPFVAIRVQSPEGPQVASLWRYDGQHWVEVGTFATGGWMAEVAVAGGMAAAASLLPEDEISVAQGQGQAQGQAQGQLQGQIQGQLQGQQQQQKNINPPKGGWK